jgi:putative ABC transport system permease protein
MRFLRLVLKNLLRNRRRSALTAASIAVSLFLVATLQAVLDQLKEPSQSPDSALRLVTRHKVSLYNLLPLSHRQEIARVEGVDAVIGWMWFGGVYKDHSNFFPNIAADADQFFQVHPDMMVTAEQQADFKKDPSAALAGLNLAKRFGWSAGHKVHLRGTLFKLDLELTVRAIYTGGVDDGGGFYFHFSNFNEGLKKLGFNAIANNTSSFTVRAHSAEAVPLVAERIDALFQNTAFPTKTETEKAFLLTFLSSFGNVKLMVNSICSVVIFAVVLVAANAMAMSIRERWREIGVLKTLGFQRGQIQGLLVGESMLLALSGTVFGAFGAALLLSQLNMSRITSGFIQHLRVTPGNLLFCLLLGCLVGIFSSWFPAWRAARRPAVEAIRRAA